MTDINFTQIESNGITMRLAHAGQGPLVLLIHGWPESWYSWRHQLRALAEAGYHAVAPDMRGYGGTSAPAEPEAYRIDHLAKDVVGIIDHFRTSNRDHRRPRLGLDGGLVYRPTPSGSY